MENFFNENVKNGFTQRLEKLQANTKPKWGIMTPSQMLKHLQLENDLALGKYKGKDYSNFFREWAFKQVIKGKMPLPMIFSKMGMVPAIPELDVIKSNVKTGNFELEKSNFLKSLDDLLNAIELSSLHPGIGKMNRDEWSFFYSWHTNYHFTQFGI